MELWYKCSMEYVQPHILHIAIDSICIFEGSYGWSFKVEMLYGPLPWLFGKCHPILIGQI
jgi:hypothetical protein